MNERIKELRKQLGMTQTEFGQKIGLSQRAIANLENGTTAVVKRNVDAICRAFNVNPSWLKTGEGDMFLETREGLIRDVAEQFGLSDGDTILLRTFLSLPQEHRAGVLAWARNFAETLAAQMGVQFPQPVKPDSELTRPEMHETLDNELDARDDARKRGITTSSASIGSNGSSKKISKSLE